MQEIATSTRRDSYIPPVTCDMEILGPEAVSGPLDLAATIYSIAERWDVPFEIPAGGLPIHPLDMSRELEEHVVRTALALLPRLTLLVKEKPSMHPDVIGIIGPPATGKTRLAGFLADKLHDVYPTDTIPIRKVGWPEEMHFNPALRDDESSADFSWDGCVVRAVVGASFKTHAAQYRVAKAPTIGDGTQISIGLGWMWHFVAMGTFYHIFDQEPGYLRGYDYSELGINKYSELPALIALIGDLPRLVFFMDSSKENAEQRAASESQKAYAKRLAAFDKYYQLRSTSLEFVAQMQYLSLKLFDKQGYFPIYYFPTGDTNASKLLYPNQTPPWLRDLRSQIVYFSTIENAARNVVVREFGQGILPPPTEEDRHRSFMFGMIDGTDPRFDC